MANSVKGKLRGLVMAPAGTVTLGGRNDMWGPLRAKSSIGVASRKLCEGSGPGDLVPGPEPLTTELSIVSCGE
jgi:hypothetical protein